MFKNKEVLSLSFVPDVMVGREREKELLSRLLVQGVNENYLPPMIRVYGPPGSGKTMLVKSVLESFSEYVGGVFRYYYTNLRGSKTVFMAANNVLFALSQRKISQNLGLDRVFDEIWKALSEVNEGKLFVIIVMDEVESIFLDKHYNASDFFYRFLRYHTFIQDKDLKLCLIVIANNPMGFEEKLDGRVRSSLGSDFIMFDHYSEKALEKILEYRIRDGFKPEFVEDDVAQNISWFHDTSFGDARVAIDLLRVSGELANKQKKKVSFKICLRAREIVERDIVYEELDELPDIYLFILWQVADICSRNDKASTREVYDLNLNYPQVVLRGNYVSSVNERRILEILTGLEVRGLITTMNISMGRRGYGKLIRLNISPKSVLSYIKGAQKVPVY